MGLIGVDDALVILLRLMGWGFGSLFIWGDKILRGTLDLTRGLVPRSAFGRMFDVGRDLSKTRFLVCLALPDSRRHPLWITWSTPMVSSNGTSCFQSFGA
jgi:hypothetical protein